MNNLKYKDIQVRILANTNEKATSDLLETINNDMKDAFMVEIHGKSEAPRKVYEFNLEDYLTISIPSSSMILDGFTVNEQNGVILSPTENSKLVVTDISEINTLRFTTLSSISGINLVGTIKILSESNVELWSDTFEILDDDSKSYEIIKNIAIKGVRMKLQIEVPEGNAQLNDFTYTKEWNELELPNDFYIPLEVMFRANQKQYISSEVTAEDFMLWNPTVLNNTEAPADITIIDEKTATYGTTQQNLDNDGKVCYYFEYLEGKVIFHWKPKFSGILSIYYAYAPTISISEGKTIDLHRMFADLLVDSVTIKILRRKIMNTKEQFTYLAIRDNISSFENHFKSLLAVYAGYVNRKAETPIISPFTFINDPSMEI